MSVISARTDEATKNQAEKIADSIGLSLSSVINIFLKRFIVEEGFPFDVTVPKKDKAVYNKDELEKAVISVLKSASDADRLPSSAYLDPKSGIVKHTE